MPTPRSDRFHWFVIGLGSLAFVFASIWILMHPERGGRGAAIAGLLFFGPGAVGMLWLAMRGKPFPQRARPRSRLQYLVLPAALLITLPGVLKLLFALPLLVAWLLLFPRYESRWALVAAAAAAATIAVAQAIVFGLSLATGMPETGGIKEIALRAVFAILVLWLDAQVVWAVRKRLLAPTAATPG